MKLESQVKNTLKKIKLSKKDKILVALSGGKDSTVTAYLLKKCGYDISGIHIDLKMGKYSANCLKATEKLCDDLGIVLYVYDVKKKMGSSMCYIRSAVQTKHKGAIKNCAICGVIKKWILNKEVRRLKFDKIATGHNLDDEAQTILINVFKGSLQLSATSGAITKNTKDKKFISRVKPLFYVLEDDVRAYTKKMKLPMHDEKCPCAIDSYRIQVRNFLEKLPGKDKINIMKNFEKISGKIKKKDLKIQYCEICGEPARGKVCKKCSLVNL